MPSGGPIVKTGMASEKSPEGLFVRNLEALHRRQPGLANYIEAITAPTSRIVGSEEAPNIDLGHVHLYEGDAKSYTERQIADFLETPSRITLGWPFHFDEPKLQSEILHTECHRFLKSEFGYERAPEAPSPDGGAMVIFGLGLGLHLPRLVSEIDVRTVIVAEQYGEFLYHAMHFIDLTEVYEILEGRNGSLLFAFADDPLLLSDMVYSLVRTRNNALVDGSYVYTHYTSFVLNKARSEIIERLPVIAVNFGFFEDELVMMENCFANIRDYEFSNYMDRNRFVKEVPAVIVGSGPSLDTAVEMLKENRDRLFIVSCGTALGALLEYGLTPDFHVETENTPGPYEILSKLAARFDFDPITLIATNTVNPKVPSLFKKRIFYFRDTVTSTRFFGRDYPQIFMAAPTVSNAAARIMLGFGFKELYLVGVDLGSRAEGLHHSKNSVYVADDKFLETHPDHQKAIKYGLDQPGNFGGRIRTNHSFLYAGVYFGTLLSKYRNATVFNLSDGIRIAHAVPKLPATVEFESTEAEKIRDIETIARELEPGDYRSLINTAELERLERSTSDFFDAIEAFVKSQEPATLDLRAFHDGLNDLLKTEDEPDPVDLVIYQMHVGTLMSLFQVLYQVNRRLVFAEEREKFTGFFLERFLARLGIMREEGLGLISRLASEARSMTAA